LQYGTPGRLIGERAHPREAAFRSGVKRRKVAMHIASRAARWSAAHWKLASFGWLAFVASAMLIGQAVGTVKLTDSEQSVGQSAAAQAILHDGGFRTHADEAVLIQSKTLNASQLAFQQELRRVATKLSTLPQITALRSPSGTTHHGQISEDGHSALIESRMKGSADSAADRVEPVLDEVKRLDRAASGFTVAEFGDASSNHELNKSINDGISKAEELSLPITFAVLLIAFGAFVAAGLPVLLAFSAVLASGGLAAIASHMFHASDATSSVMLLMGMAVGVDY